MSYFEEEKNVDAYIKMADGYNSFKLIDELKKYLEPGSSILELGMGPGIDLDYLAQVYDVTGSDMSDEFLNRYIQKHPDGKVLKLDALTIETELNYDCIFSAKVLQHLKKDKLVSSLKRQTEILTEEGLALHSLWLGNGTEEYDGLFFQYYSTEEVLSIFGQFFDIEKNWVYTEMEENDSIAVIGRKK